MAQLKYPTDDTFHLPQGLSLLMTKSKHSAIKRRRYYDEALATPMIREILDEEAFKSTDGKYRDCSRNTLNLLAATFGIVLIGKKMPIPFQPS